MMPARRANRVAAAALFLKMQPNDIAWMAHAMELQAAKKRKAITRRAGSDAEKVGRLRLSEQRLTHCAATFRRIHGLLTTGDAP